MGAIITIAIVVNTVYLFKTYRLLKDVYTVPKTVRKHKSLRPSEYLEVEEVNE